ncbi:MAG: hypothetical protein PHY02_05465 [Phycisphaerae bacterium]|nr:hypothetical protein [Phycisphaerae bacterium]
MDNLPRHAGGKYKRYSQAIEELDKPEEFTDRTQYRLLKVDGTKFVFSNHMYSYFDKINYGEYLVYELEHHNLEKSWFKRHSNRKQLLQQIQEPYNHIVLCGIDTLTMLHNGTELRIIMHIRGADKTATSMGTYHVIPAGEFQPSCIAPASIKEDLNLWKNIMREYAEELLGMDEYDGNSAVPINYGIEPFVSLENERTNGNIRPFYLGFGLEPASLQGEILTVVVFKEETFNKIFPNVLTENREGEIITDKDRWGRQFTEEEYNSYREANILPTTAAILDIAWNQRKFFQKIF